jgi:hypothetical protein
VPVTPLATPALAFDSPSPGTQEVAISVAVRPNGTFGAKELSITDAFPNDLRAARLSCDASAPKISATLLLHIETDGHVSGQRIEAGSGNDRLDQALLHCLTTRVAFTPRYVGGDAVQSWQRLHWD